MQTIFKTPPISAKAERGFVCKHYCLNNNIYVGYTVTYFCIG